MALHKIAVDSDRAALVVKSVQICRAGPEYVRIEGRKSGVLSWLLSLLRLMPTVTFVVREKCVEYSDGSLAGHFTKKIPLATVSNLESGFLKPFGYLFLAAAGVVLAYHTSGVSLCLTAVFTFMYFFGRSMKLVFVPQSGKNLEFSFKRSLIEWVNLTEDDAKQIISIISDLMEKSSGA